MDGRGVGQELAGFGVQFGQLDAAPEGAPCQPDPAVGIGQDAGIDGVEVHAGLGFDDHALVDPLEVGAVGVECLIGSQADEGALAAEGGGGIIEAEVIADFVDIGGPQFAACGDFFFDPVGYGGKHIGAAGPGQQVFGFDDADDAAHPAGGEDVVGVLVLDDVGVVDVGCGGAQGRQAAQDPCQMLHDSSPD